MIKAEITVRQLLTLLGANAIVRILDEKKGRDIEEQTVFHGTVAKLHHQLQEEDAEPLIIKHISPNSERDSYGRYVTRIYIY